MHSYKNNAYKNIIFRLKNIHKFIDSTTGRERGIQYPENIYCENMLVVCNNCVSKKGHPYGNDENK